MSMVQVQVMNQDQLDKMQALLAGIPGGIEKASRSAMQRAVSHLRTNSAKAIQEKYDISVANIRANENIFVRYTATSAPTSGATGTPARSSVGSGTASSKRARSLWKSTRL